MPESEEEFNSSAVSRLQSLEERVKKLEFDIQNATMLKAAIKERERIVGILIDYRNEHSVKGRRGLVDAIQRIILEITKMD